MATSNIINHLSGLRGFVAATLIDTYHRQVIESISHANESIDGMALDNAQVILNRLDRIRTKRKRPVDSCLFFRLSEQYHIVRQSRHCPDIFIYLVIDFSCGDLDQARIAVKNLDARIRV
ncbi:MAG: hypothetical protein AB3X41_05385 [Leptothrix ochracea]|uniref:hypothetical protein n=1 Tax=Leptothrix ochracea TaxID=735331 RepID=UPI0034E217C7